MPETRRPDPASEERHFKQIPDGLFLANHALAFIADIDEQAFLDPEV
jgi:hypothetical protein